MININIWDLRKSLEEWECHNNFVKDTFMNCDIALQLNSIADMKEAQKARRRAIEEDIAQMLERQDRGFIP